MRHLELAVFKILVRQAETVDIKNGYYTADLIVEIVKDPRITEADLDLVAYKNLLGDAEWSELLKKHAH